MFWKSTSLKGSMRCPFKQVDMVRDIIVSGGAYDPLDNDSPETYTIPAGTPMLPLSTGLYKPWRKAIATVAENSKTVEVSSTEALRAGDLVALWTSLTGTADHRTIDSVPNATTVVLTAVATTAAGDTIEVRENGAHDGTTAALTYTTMPTDVVLTMGDVCVYHLTDGSTFDTPAVGVLRGQIAVSDVNGPESTFDETLRVIAPGVDFIALTPGG
jgi:hypothetical protein